MSNLKKEIRRKKKSENEEAVQINTLEKANMNEK